MSKKYQTGFSLMEILVSVLIVSFGLLSLASLQISSVKSVNNAHSNNIASLLTMELSERMRSNLQGVAGGFYGNSVSCSDKLKQCRGSAICSAEETAKYDLQEVMCGTIVDNKSQGGATNLLPQGRLKVACAGGCNQPDVAHNITIAWGNSSLHKAQDFDSKTVMLTTAIIP